MTVYGSSSSVLLMLCCTCRPYLSAPFCDAWLVIAHTLHGYPRVPVRLAPHVIPRRLALGLVACGPQT